MPAIEPLAPVVAPLAVEPVIQGRALGSEPGCVIIGEPLMLGTFGREPALGLAGLTAPGIADCVEVGLLTVPGILLFVPTVPGSWPLLVLGDGVDGATPGAADPGDMDGAVARPVAPVDGAVPVPLAPPLDTPDDPVPCAYAEAAEALMMIAANPAARMSFFDMPSLPQRAFLNEGPTCWLSASSGEVPYEGQPCVKEGAKRGRDGSGYQRDYG